MRRSSLGVLFRNEIRMVLRDTRTLLIAVVAPIVLFPLMAFVVSTVEDREQTRLEEATYAWAFVEAEGGDPAAASRIRTLVDSAIARLARDSVPTDFEESRTGGPAEADSLLEAGDLALVVTAEVDDSLGVPAVALRYRAPSDLSRRASDALRGALEELREARRDSLWAEAGFPVSRDEVAVVEGENVATAAQEAGAFFGLALTPFLVLLMLGGGSIVAADAISGEKERGTLETLLTSAAHRGEIVRAKLLAVIAVGVTVGLVNLANVVVYANIGVFDLPARFTVDLSVPEMALLLALILPITVLVGAALLLLSGFSKSYKEYQTWFFPLFLGFLVPTLAPMLPGMELASAVAFIPVAGVGVAIRDLMVGDLDLLFAGIAILSTGGTGVWLTRVTERALSNERLISNAGMDEADHLGGEALFPKHVLGWFLGFWVLFFVASLWFGETLGVRGQIVLNLVGIFFGGSLFLIRRYRLPVRDAFALRPPHPATLVAVLIAAPATLLLGLGLGELVDRFLFPVPDRIVEAFGEQLGLGLPLWQLLLFVAVMPAIFEELAFRGVLVKGLRDRRLPTWAIIVAGGAIFGLFHVALFRILPTAWLGMNLVAAVLLTRSIWPVVLWHFLNNAIALVPMQLGWIDPTAFEAPTWTAIPALGALALAWAVMWRFAPEEGRRAFTRPVPPGTAPGSRSPAAPNPR